MILSSLRAQSLSGLGKVLMIGGRSDYGLETAFVTFNGTRGVGNSTTSDDFRDRLITKAQSIPYYISGEKLVDTVRLMKRLNQEPDQNFFL